MMLKSVMVMGKRLFLKPVAMLFRLSLVAARTSEGGRGGVFYAPAFWLFIAFVLYIICVLYLQVYGRNMFLLPNVSIKMRAWPRRCGSLYITLPFDPIMADLPQASPPLPVTDLHSAQDAIFQIFTYFVL